MTIGETIRFLRKEKGLTQKELSEKTGIAVITIHGYESDKYKPRQDKLEKLAEAFNVPVLCFFNYDNSPELKRAYLMRLPIGKRIQVLRIWSDMTLEEFSVKLFNLSDTESLTNGEFDFLGFVNALENENIGSINASMACILENIFNIPTDIFGWAETDNCLIDNEGQIITDDIINTSLKFNDASAPNERIINTIVSSKELLILEYFRKLNSSGQKIILELAEDFTYLLKYIKPDSENEE